MAVSASAMVAISRPIYFFHIPKTGGRTIARYLSSRFGRRAISNPKKNKAIHADICLGRKNVGGRVVDPDAPAKPHVIGHYASFSLIARCPDAYLKVCFWRHPADWLLSLYNFRHHRNRGKLVRSYGFGIFCRSMLRNPMTEHLLMHCGDVSGLTYFFMSDRAKFLAAARLVEKFDRFEDISGVDAFLASLRGEHDAKPRDYNRLESSQKVLASLDAASRDQLARNNAIDHFLHRLSLGEDRGRVVEDARRTLNGLFDPRDAGRLLLVPVFRFAVWVLPRWRIAGPVRRLGT
jgi:hypothetical protein